MTNSQLLNIFFFALGIASCLFVIFSITMRIIRKELEKMKSDFINEIKKGNIGVSH